MLWFSRWSLGIDSLNSEDLIPVTQPHVIGKPQDGSRSRVESQFYSLLGQLVGHISFCDGLCFRLWHSGKCCEAWQGKVASPIPAGGKVLPSFTAAQPGLHGWLPFDGEKGLCSSLKVACPDYNPLLKFLSNKENFHSHLICLDHRGSASQTSLQMENKKLVWALKSVFKKLLLICLMEYSMLWPKAGGVREPPSI